MNLEGPLEISPGQFKRLGDCSGPEIEAALRQIARRRIDLAWAREQAAGGNADGRTIARHFFVDATEDERNLFAYWQVVKVLEADRLDADS